MLRGDGPFFRRVISPLRKRILAAAIGPGLVDYEQWRLRPGAAAAVRILERPAVVVFYTTRSDILLPALSKWREVGVRKILPSAAWGPLVYFVAELETRLDILFKVSKNLLGILRVHKLDIWRWLDDLISKASTEGDERLRHLRRLQVFGLMKLERLGGFYVGSPEHI